MLCTHMMGKSGWERKMLEKAAGESRGEPGIISEQAGEADLIQVWGFALTVRDGVGAPAWY